ncbi:glycoside hydrolase superfamily [Blakeslea trispora]|nr:glycoside hydrolase superfamily [Blakeslea trispora]
MELNGRWFIDSKTKRTVLFKGVNLSGGTKLPIGVPSHERNGYWVDYDRKISFVGRPFPLDEADKHLKRFVNLGFNLLRFLVTWEALEHEGPGIYDEEYIAYVIQILKKCQDYHIQAYIDPHQDCWSRHCGGSGHPGWTLPLAGLNPLHFSETNAAIVHNLYPESENYPKMIWNTNYQKLAAATMFTLFFAGKTFAPKCIVNGVHVQDYLQNSFIKCFEHFAKAVHQYGLEDTVVIGYDTMNEPGQGYLSVPHLNQLSQDDVSFKMGLMPTSFQGMLLGSGIPTKVEYWEFKWDGPKKTDQVLVDPGHLTAWLTETELQKVDAIFGWKRSDTWPAGCIWANHGVWNKETQQLLKPDYFVTNPLDHRPTHYIDYWKEHVVHYAQTLRAIHSRALLFVQPPVLEVPPEMPASLDRLVYAPHWYDGLTLVKKKWCSYNVDFINLNRGKYGTGPLRFIRALRVGEKAIRQCFVDQIQTIKTEGLQQIGEYPCILGEIGIPYDMETGQTRKEDPISDIGNPLSSQNKALDANLNAMDKNLLSYSLWNYMSDNDPQWGDQWNGEDLSIWQSPSDESSSSLTAELELSITDQSTMLSTASSSTMTPDHDEDEEDKVTGTTAADKLPWTNSNQAESTDSLQALLRQYQQHTNRRNVISLHRPHPRLTAGIPISIHFQSPTDKIKAKFDYTISYNTACTSPTEIYLPSCHFPLPPTETKVETTQGYWKVHTCQEHYWILHWFINEQTKQEGGLATLSVEGILVN